MAVQCYTQTDKNVGGVWSKNEACPRTTSWVVYENSRAYPVRASSSQCFFCIYFMSACPHTAAAPQKYVVRYYRGEFDPARVRFASREEASAAAADFEPEPEPEA